MTVRKTGAEHIKSLQDGRTVFIDGKRVADVTEHPAFRNSVRSAASLYDVQARPENLALMTFVPDGSTRRVNRAWQMPRNYDEMVLRRKAMQAWGALIMLPSSVHDFADPQLKAIIGKTQRSASMSPEQKVKFLKAAWDAIGSEFGSRHTQYEMFYAGAQFVTRSHSFRTFDWNGATGLVDKLMSTYDLGGELDAVY